jgi:hypothetical protein
MDVISIAFLCFMGLCFLTIPALLLSFKIEDKIEKRIEKRLLNVLVGICNKLNIPLSYHETLDIAAGRILYYSRCGRLFVDKAEIQIANKFKNCPSVLAHELGHYYAIQKHEDNSEKAADFEALELCKSILTKHEQKVMKIWLKSFFVHDKEEVAC